MDKKPKFSRVIAFGLLFPLLGTALLSVTFCILQKNYYYLPRSLDFLIRFFYDAKFIFLYIALFFFVGMVVRTIAFTPLRDAVAVSVSGLFFTVLTAMTSFVITLVFLRNDLSADVFGTYLYSDFLCAMENAARYFLCVVAAWAVRLFYSSRGTSPSFEKPYIVPKGAVGFPLAVSLAVWLAVTVCGVAFSSVTENAVGTLVYELVVCVCGYFIAVLGAIFISK